MPKQNILNKRNIILTFIAAFCVFGIMRAYEGLYMDGLFYLFQAVHPWIADRFTTDLFFMFGNQDQYSVFSPLYRLFISAFGIPVGSFVLYELILFGIVSALFAIVWKLNSKWALPVLLLLAVSPSRYSYGMWHFSYLEKLAIARSLAEVFLLWGVYLLLFTKRKWLPLLVFIAGMAVHPLMCGWGLALWLVYQYPKMLKYIVVLSLIFPAVVLLNVGPFAPFDDLWAQVNTTRAGVFNGPTLNDALRVTCYFAVLLVCYKLPKMHDVRNFVFAILVLGSIAFYWALMGTWTRCIFIVQVQPNRFEWVMAVFAKIFGMIAILRYVPFLVQRWALLTLNWRRRLFASLVALCAIYSFIIIWKVLADSCALSFPVPVLMRNMDALRSFAMVTAALFAVASFAGKNIDYGRGASLALFCAFPEMPAFLWLALLGKRLPRRQMILFLVLCAVAGLLLCPLWTSFPLMNTSNWIRVRALPDLVLFFAVAYMLICRTPYCTKYLWIQAIGFLFLFLFVADARLLPQKKDERQMNFFLHETIFPQVRDRGRILFQMQSNHVLPPREIFMTGAYFEDPLAAGGDLFFRAQYVEFARRKSLIKMMDATGLCRINEIDYVVSDGKKEGLVPRDSVNLPDNDGLAYLLACPGR